MSEWTDDRVPCVSNDDLARWRAQPLPVLPRPGEAGRPDAILAPPIDLEVERLIAAVRVSEAAEAAARAALAARYGTPAQQAAAYEADRAPSAWRLVGGSLACAAFGAFVLKPLVERAEPLVHTAILWITAAVIVVGLISVAWLVVTDFAAARRR